jgi:hypothetical protein
VTDLVEDRAEIFVMDPFRHLRNDFQSPLAEVKYIYYISLYNSLYKSVPDENRPVYPVLIQLH